MQKLGHRFGMIINNVVERTIDTIIDIIANVTTLGRCVTDSGDFCYQSIGWGNHKSTRFSDNSDIWIRKVLFYSTIDSRSEFFERWFIRFGRRVPRETTANVEKIHIESLLSAKVENITSILDRIRVLRNVTASTSNMKGDTDKFQVQFATSCDEIQPIRTSGTKLLRKLTNWFTIISRNTEDN